MPIVTELEELWKGVIIPTFKHPEGFQKRVGILPAIADLLGIRKLLGFAAVNALKFCSFCDLEHNKLSVIDEVVGHPRIGEDVRQAGRAYLDAPTIKKWNKLFKASGVRFSTVQQLSYRDPVRHTVLGMMHNWLEGLLQHHARIKWGIGDVTSKGKKTELMTEDVDEEQNEAGSYTDTSMTDSMDMDVDIQYVYGLPNTSPIFC